MSDSVAYLKSVKGCAEKFQAVARQLVDLPAGEAIKRLSFSNTRFAKVVKDVVYSAMMNAENNKNLDIDSLVVKRVDVGKSITLKRVVPRARGRADRIVKKFSNIRVVLTEKSE